MGCDLSNFVLENCDPGFNATFLLIFVKYTNGGNRGREVYTEVAVTRFLWGMGLRGKHVIRGKAHSP